MQKGGIELQLLPFGRPFSRHSNHPDSLNLNQHTPDPCQACLIRTIP